MKAYPHGSRFFRDSGPAVAGGENLTFSPPESPLLAGPIPPSRTTTITYTYDSLYRLTAADYDTGAYFHYTYDATGNTLGFAQNIVGLELTTTYTYNAANQLTTAQESNNPTVWQYNYDNNGSLKEVLPDGLPGDGAQKYKYNTAGYLTQVEKYLGGSYQIQAQMAYNGRGDRLSVTASGVTTTYSLDLTKGSQPLVATAGGVDTTYLYGLSAVAEHTDAWSYYLKDGLGTPRQLVDPAGQVTLGRDFTPWGEVLGQFGEGNFSFGYLGGLMDAATGLIYMGNGQYYDPATGRLLNPVRNYDSETFQNPYLPSGYADPTLALMAPLVLLTLMMGGRKKRGKGDKWIIMLVLALAIGMSLAACGGETGTGTDPSPSTGQDSPTTPPNQGNGTPQPPEEGNTGGSTQAPGGGSTAEDPVLTAVDCTPTGTLIPNPTPVVETSPTPTMPENSPVINIDAPLGVPAKPDGLNVEGEKAYKSIKDMITGSFEVKAHWGVEEWWFVYGDGALSLRELMVILLANEIGTISYQPGPGEWALPSIAIDAATRKYNEHCSNGPFSTNCINKFWGYYEPIRAFGFPNPDKDHNQVYNALYLNPYNYPEGAGGNVFGEVLLSAAENVLTRPQLGGWKWTAASEWATLKESVNRDTYDKFKNQVKDVPGGVYGHEFYDYGKGGCGTKGRYPDGCPGESGYIFLIMSPQKNQKFCKKYLNIDSVCSIVNAD